MPTYFHDKKGSAVYEVSGIFASEQFSNHKPPRFLHTDVRGHVKVTKPTWWKVGDRWTNTEGSAHHNTYEKDREAQAKDYFVRVHCHMGGLTEIDRTTYDALVTQFDAQAKANPPADDA
ncbi:MAG: hypothetical protein IPI67_37300 [Myxococcales bacterium]|nr:hypothetical protein [Myxococcales bacterium]